MRPACGHPHDELVALSSSNGRARDAAGTALSSLQARHVAVVPPSSSAMPAPARSCSRSCRAMSLFGCRPARSRCDGAPARRRCSRSSGVDRDVGSNTKAFHANRPPGRSARATRSKTRRRSAQVGKCRSAPIRADDVIAAGSSRREVAHVAFAADRARRPPSAARARASASSIAGDGSIPITCSPGSSRAIGIATRPVPTASSTTGPSASRASST